MLRRLSLWALPLAALTLLLWACNPVTNRAERQLGGMGWLFADSLEIEVQARDTQPRNLVVAVTLNENYPYRNLWLRTSVRQPGRPASHSRVEFLLADVEGKWLVKQGFDNTMQVEAVLAQAMRLKPDSVYHFGVAQYMRMDTLPGVERVELRVELP